METLLVGSWAVGACIAALAAVWLHIEHSFKSDTAVTVGVVLAVLGPLTAVLGIILGSYGLFRVLRAGLRDLWSMRPWREKIPKARVL